MKMQSKIIFLLFVLIGIGFIALFFSGSLSDIKQAISLGNPVKVNVAEARIEKLSKYFGANGSSEPSRILNISVPPSFSKTDNLLTVDQVNVKIGDLVKEGQILAVLSNKSLGEEVTKTRKDLNDLRSGARFLNEARTQKAEYFNSIQSLFDKGFANRDELESARNALNQSEIESINLQKQLREKVTLLKQLLVNIDGLEVLSPLDGVVISKQAEIGQVLSSGSEFFSIGATVPLNIVANVSQEDVSYLFVGQDAEVSFNYMPEIEHQGKVINIYPSVDLDSQTTKVVISLENRDGKLIPGLLASVRFSSVKEALVVPKLSVLGPSGENNVYVLNESNNKVFLSKVITGQIFLDGKIEILEGLSKGQKVAISNIERLEDGISVKISQN